MQALISLSLLVAMFAIIIWYLISLEKAAKIVRTKIPTLHEMQTRILASRSFMLRNNLCPVGDLVLVVSPWTDQLLTQHPAFARSADVLMKQSVAGGKIWGLTIVVQPLKSYYQIVHRNQIMLEKENLFSAGQLSDTLV